jgi:hypothetical protein
MRTYGNGCIDPRIRDLDTSWTLSGQLHVPAALPPGKELPVPTVRRLGETQRREEKRKIFPLPGLEFRPYGRPAGSLRYPGSLLTMYNMYVSVNGFDNNE